MAPDGVWSEERYNEIMVRLCRFPPVQWVHAGPNAYQEHQAIHGLT